MRDRRRAVAAGVFPFLLSALAAALPATGPALSASGSIDGRWRLVEERRGGSEPTVVPADEALRIEFLRDGPGVRGRIWPRGARSAPREWPAFESGGRPAPIAVEALTVEPGLAGLSVRYRVGPHEPTGRQILVEETYRAAGDGRSLEGDVRVTDVVGGKPGGSYVLHRRFERER